MTKKMPLNPSSSLGEGKQFRSASNVESEDIQMVSDYVNRRLEAVAKVSKDGKKINKLYDLLSKKELWFQAYQNIAPNKGAVTRGPDEVTLDGFSEGRVESLIKLLKSELYRSKPSRRVYIPKANGKLRPLGIPAGDDKLVQECTRIILERIYEPVFSDWSHGFRKGRSCHTALKHIRTWKSTKWFLEFDIKGFFDNIDHKKMIEFLSKKIDDRKFLNLVRNMLRAGVLEEWKFKRTYSGTPQGGVVSPILANIYLHELDQFIGQLAEEFNQGQKRKMTKAYWDLGNRISGIRRKAIRIKAEQGSDADEFKSCLEEIKRLKLERREIPALDPNDPKYKRLRYCRYADDFLLGLSCSRSEAEAIKNRVTTFIRENLGLDISVEKTGIRHAKDGVIFLGYGVKTYTGERVVNVATKDGKIGKRRTLNGALELFVPKSNVVEFCRAKRYGELATFSFQSRRELTPLSEYEIVTTYNAELRGFANYYVLARDVNRRLKPLSYLANYSLMATLAAKEQSTISTIARKLREDGELVYRYQSPKGEKALRIYQVKHLDKDSLASNVDVKPNTYLYSSRTELLTRLTANECEYCGKQGGYFEVHHVRKLGDLAGKEVWEKQMIQRRRKTLVLCNFCHQLLHQGSLPDFRRQKQ